MQDPWIHESGNRLEPMALPATGDVVELVGARMHRSRRPHRPPQTRGFDSRRTFAALEDECDRFFRKIVVGALVVALGLVTWLGAASAAPVDDGAPAAPVSDR